MVDSFLTPAPTYLPLSPHAATLLLPRHRSPVYSPSTHRIPADPPATTTCPPAHPPPHSPVSPPNGPVCYSLSPHPHPSLPPQPSLCVPTLPSLCHPTHPAVSHQPSQPHIRLHNHLISLSCIHTLLQLPINPPPARSGDCSLLPIPCPPFTTCSLPICLSPLSMHAPTHRLTATTLPSIYSATHPSASTHPTACDVPSIHPVPPRAVHTCGA